MQSRNVLDLINHKFIRNVCGITNDDVLRLLRAIIHNCLLVFVYVQEMFKR